MTRQEVNWIFFSCEHDFVSRVLVFVLNGYQLFSCKLRFILSIFVSGYNDYFKETCELG